MTRIVRWSAIALIVTALFASLYLVMQQIERQGADDAPGRLASQVASQLSGSGRRCLGRRRRRSRRQRRRILRGLRRGGPPGLGHRTARRRPGRRSPPGCWIKPVDAGTNHVTWQTADGRRFATVEQRAGDSVVLGGQSLAPTEKRIDQLGLLILVAWLCVLAIVVVAFLVERVTPGGDAVARR